MRMTRVESSNILAVGYDEDLRILHIRFHSGGTYAYQDVTPAVFESLLNAKSVGSFFETQIKPNYNGSRIS